MRFRSFIFLMSLLCLPARVLAGEVTVRLQDLQQVAPGMQVATGLEIPPTDVSLPIVAATSDTQVATLLRSYDARGLSNSFEGILYDNRDRGHSRLDPKLYPRLHHLKYGDALEQKDADYGLAGMILYPAVVFGNSSTAITGGVEARSLPRLAMTSRLGRELSARLYRNNHIYIYPEHRDFDEVDRFPAHWPYHIVSQGSSGSDRPFMRAIAATLAAFPSDTLDYMKEHGLVAPTLQMILRRNLRPVNQLEHYLAGSAHRPVLNGSEVRPERMVGHAAALRPEDIPPMAQIAVIEEDFRDAAGLAQMSEKLYDTPSAVARIWRGFEGIKTLTVSAENTVDPMGKPVTYMWRLLQGNPDRIRITPVGDNGQQARISIAWHDPFDVQVTSAEGHRQIQTSRVDIGLFASSGREQSAPAILSISFPAHQIRTYGRSNTGGLRLNSINYDALGRDTYYDPVVHWSAPWTDTAIVDTSGTLTEWRRAFSGDGRVETTVPADNLFNIHELGRVNGRPVLDYVQ